MSVLKLGRKTVTHLPQRTLRHRCDLNRREYLDRSDWRVNANANQGYSLPGGTILNSATGKMIASYWLERVYSPEAGAAHRSGDIPHPRSRYVRGLLRRMVAQATDPLSSRVSGAIIGTPENFSSACGQIVNFLGTAKRMGGRTGASPPLIPWPPSFHTDNMTYEQIVQACRN